MSEQKFARVCALMAEAMRALFVGTEARAQRASVIYENAVFSFVKSKRESDRNRCFELHSEYRQLRSDSHSFEEAARIYGCFAKAPWLMELFEFEF